VPTTAGRTRGRQGVRSGAQGAVGEHMSKIMTALITALVVVAFALVMTKPGRAVDAATQRFMLYYAGVFALIGLTASVGVGLLATDRIVMTPGHRVMAQAVHQAVSFGALAFLVIHIVAEILAQRVHVIDAVIPFLSPYRTFYIGLGTIASDLILLVVISSIFRKRFTTHGKAWRWRAIHYSSYLAFVFGVLHGLLGGRAAKPYVDWSYGVAIALTGLALVVRFLAISLRPKESVSTPPGADRTPGGPGYSGTSPLRSATLSMAQAHLGGTIQMLPAATGAHHAVPGSQPWAAIPAPGWSATSGPIPALGASPAYAGESPYGAISDHELMPLGAPVHGDGIAVGAGGYPYAVADPPRRPAAAGHANRQPLYEPGYDGPPRFMGAPRKHVPQDDVRSYPYGPQSYRQPATGYGDHRAESGSPSAGATSPGPDRNNGPIAKASTGPMPRAGTGPMPHGDSGPMPRAGTGPMPRAGTGPMPRAGTGPMPRAGTGPMPRAGSGPVPRHGTGPTPRTAPGPMPTADSGPMPRLGPGPMARHDPGPVPRAGTGPMPRADSGPTLRLGTDRMPRPHTGAMPRAGTSPMPRADSGPMPRLGTGPEPRPDSHPAGRSATGPVPRSGTGLNRLTPVRPQQRAAAGFAPDTGAIRRPHSPAGPRTDLTPRATGSRSRRADSTDPGYRDGPERTRGAGWV
jgi:DMSO/TMAO reductase YedYZ heme-binding membrane subunit